MEKFFLLYFIVLGGGVNRFENGTSNGTEGMNGHVERKDDPKLEVNRGNAAHQWGIGELEWEAWCRELDRAVSAGM